MWVHIVIFVMIALAAVACHAGILPAELCGEKRGRRLFLLVAVSGNMLGMLLTLQGGSEKIYSRGYRMDKEETGGYEEKLMVSVDGEEESSMYVQIPQRETGEGEIRQEQEEELSPQEERERELLEEIARYNQEKNDPDYYYLPDTWEGKKLEWRKPADTSGTLLAGLCLAAAAALLAINGREEQVKTARRHEQLLMDYPGLIMKFTLLIQAGMTARKAFEKIAADYRGKAGTARYAYEEIVNTCYEMDSGISEGEAYRRLGERCGQVKYKTFSTLLIQNLQKGSRHLSDMLEKESTEAWEERKRKARVLGEAAATKLLAPMMLMLLVVMAIIMIPACLSFYGGM